MTFDYRMRLSLMENLKWALSSRQGKPLPKVKNVAICELAKYVSDVRKGFLRFPPREP